MTHLQLCLVLLVLVALAACSDPPSPTLDAPTSTPHLGLAQPTGSAIGPMSAPVSPRPGLRQVFRRQPQPPHYRHHRGRSGHNTGSGRHAHATSHDVCHSGAAADRECHPYSGAQPTATPEPAPQQIPTATASPSNPPTNPSYSQKPPGAGLQSPTNSGVLPKPKSTEGLAFGL